MEPLREFASRTLGPERQEWEPIRGGGSDRRYLRVRSGSRSAVAVMSADPAELRAFLAFTRHFASRGIPVPEILDCDEGRGFYLLEDLGPQTLRDWLAGLDATAGGREIGLRALERVLRWLPVIQVKGGAGLDYSLCLSDPAMGSAAFEADLRLFREQFAARFAPEHPPDAAVLADLSQAALRCGALESRHFCYRDFQTRNIMWRGGEPVFIDYQSGRKGPLMYDLVSILYSPDSRLDEPGRERLIGVYREALGECGVSPSREEFLRDFYTVVLLRRLQALGAYARMALEKGKREHLKNIAPSVATLRDLLAQGKIAAESPALKAWLLTVLNEPPRARIGEPG